MDELQPQTQNAKRGFFIVFEGIDGSGTTTQSDELTSYLQQQGQKVFLTNEPSNGPAGMLIRLALAKRLLGPNYEFHDPEEQVTESGTALDPYTMALLFAADRADHVATQIRPNLDRGRHVICDRYLLSTLAYQGQTLPVEWLLRINQASPCPDLTLYLDVPPEKAHVRMRQTRWSKDLFEEESQQRQIRRAYLDLIAAEHEQIGPVVVIDASRPFAQVRRHIINVAEEFLGSGSAEEALGLLSLPL